MIPRAERLPVSGEARKPLFVSRTAYFTIKVFPAGAPKARFAIIIGKSVYKGAVKRNHLRRILARELREHFSTGSPKDILLLALPSAGKVGDEVITKELQEALRSISSRA